jgi:tripartite-type tricarboxylate transporter receptor subunit TctC
MRALVVTGGRQSLPDGPTVAESGVADYSSSLWQAIVAPAAVSPSIIARFNREIMQILNEPDSTEALNKPGVEPDPGTPETLSRRIGVDMRNGATALKTPRTHEIRQP